MRFFQIHVYPGLAAKIAMPTLLFLVSIVAYLFVADARHKENPDDQVVPTLSQMIDGFSRATFEADRKGNYRLPIDTLASGKRFFISLAFLMLAVVLGLHMGIFPYMDLLLFRFVTFFDKIPALALLPILFIVFGLGELSKVALILLGVFPTITLDTYLRTKAVPREQIIKAFSLGAGNMAVAYRVVLPQIWPKVLDTIRLNFKAMILFLIAGESLAATAGLGYRIFVLRRYIAMDIIIPYVLYMSMLAFIGDLAVSYWVKKRYRWVEAS